MEIRLKRSPGAPFETVQIDGTVTGEELVGSFGKDAEYRILAMKVGNSLRELTEVIDSDCDVELLDMRNHGANLVYQRSLSLIYIKAVKDVLGDVRVEIDNSLNKGVYTEIRLPVAVKEQQVRKISARMQEIVDADMPITKMKMTREEAVSYFNEHGQLKKAELLEQKKDLKDIECCQLDGYRNFFYGQMVPSTGYIEHFELKKYRRGVILRFPHPSRPDRVPDYVDERKLCSAFGESKKWHNLLDVAYLCDLNEKVERGEFKETVLLSEALHEKKIAEIADQICRERKRIILLAGPSSSGKTTSARRLCVQLKVNGLDPLYLGTDDYFVEREDTPLDENGEPNYEDLNAVDIELFNDNMNALLEGELVDLPEFDFIQGKKVFGKRLTQIDPDQPIVIEGIHALNPELTKYIDDAWKFRIYISPFVQINMDYHSRIPTTDARMIRRMVRDYKYRGKSAHTTLEEWPKVRKGEDKNIFPYNGTADVLFNSALSYELGILKKYAVPLLEDIGPEEAQYSEAQRMLQMLQFVEDYEDDSVVPNNSILKEFIGGSIFVE